MAVNYKTNSRAHILLNEYYDTNLNRYIKEHPGEWVLVEPREYAEDDLLKEENFFKEEDVIENFFKRKSELEKTIDEKYGKAVGYTIIRARIPDTRE